MSRGSVESVRSPEYGVLVELLREAWKASRLTQKQICDRLGKDKTYLNKIERGERRIDLVELFQLCEVMGLDPVAFIGGFAKALVDSGLR